MKNRPRLDNLPKNANKRNIRKKMSNELVTMSLDCDEQEAREDLKRMLEIQFLMMSDDELQEVYDEVMDIEDKGFE